MPSLTPHFDSASDIEKGTGLTLEAVDWPTLQPSKNSLSPTCSASFAPLKPAGDVFLAVHAALPHNLPALDHRSQSDTSSVPEMLPIVAEQQRVIRIPARSMGRPILDHTISPSRPTALLALPALPFSSNTSSEEENPIVAKSKCHPSHARNSTPPAAPTSRWVHFILYFNCYRRFFTFIITLNTVGILMAGLGHFTYAQDNTGAFILGNLCAAVLVRNEIFGRFLYLIVNTCLRKWPPLCVRLAATSTLQHLGGIHSGCAVSGTGWLLFRVGTLLGRASRENRAVVVSGIITVIAVLITLLSALPYVRSHNHNKFEQYHRFVGWIGLFFTWFFVVLGNGFNYDSGEWNWIGGRILRSQDFFFVFTMTISIFLPWACTRKVAVDVEIPSSKVAILRFERGMQQGLLGRLSRTSILEYHAFGIVSEGKDAKYHYMVCGVQGDFTQSLVKNPPTHIWTREVKFAGVSNTSTIYKRGIRIATGTGIGSALSSEHEPSKPQSLKGRSNPGSKACLQNKDWFLIWIGSDQEKTFGKTISGLIESGIEPERRILWDTKKLKRPNTMKLLKDTFDSFGAEVVFITSNLGGNTEMMEGCKSLGIPCFGTLWDF